MAWIIPAEADVLTVLSETELSTYREAATATGQMDPLAPTLAQVVDLIRGYVGANRLNTLGETGSIPQKLLGPALDLLAVRLPQRVGVPPKEVRKRAADQAVRLLEQVAAGTFVIEEPEAVSGETTSFARPTVSANARDFTPSSENGV